MRVRPPRRLEEQQVRGGAPGLRRGREDGVPHKGPAILVCPAPSRPAERVGVCQRLASELCTLWHVTSRTWVAQAWRWPSGERVAAAAPPNATHTAACSPARSTRHSGAQPR